MIRWLVWQFRTAFLCDHKFAYDEQMVNVRNEYGSIEERYTAVSATCEKCGWHRKYKKF